MTDLSTLKYSPEHEWLRLEGDVAVIGITDYAADKLGDIVFVDLPAVGATVVAGEVAGEIESTKSVGELYSPVDGEVVAVNGEASDDPSLVSSDPYGQGWLMKLKVDPAAADGLLNREAYLALTGGGA
ncbi:glycine cleavage system protein GcvH [Microbacterium sediminicola]|uniref:Glycine cleavage system H protein n=1 Tax=Microbacterium sediminicola TaxID=415210 RepID=A0ABN2I185_9MICO